MNSLESQLGKLPQVVQRVTVTDPKQVARLLNGGGVKTETFGTEEAYRSLLGLLSSDFKLLRGQELDRVLTCQKDVKAVMNSSRDGVEVTFMKHAVPEKAQEMKVSFGPGVHV